MRTAEEIIQEVERFSAGSDYACLAIMFETDVIKIDVDDLARVAILREAMECGGRPILMMKSITGAQRPSYNIAVLREAAGDPLAVKMWEKILELGRKGRS